MTDQMAFGRRRAMHLHLDAGNNRHLFREGNKYEAPVQSIEGYLKRNAMLCALAILCVDFQYGKKLPPPDADQAETDGGAGAAGSCPRLGIPRPDAFTLELEFPSKLLRDPWIPLDHVPVPKRNR
mmetsp:Transcript_24276/g.45423  ORF Transcript_24276/g.45423 Transcript_24276/m.45423 type:complete len:125 (+) Transcript_24276:1390-1764(+)